MTLTTTAINEGMASHSFVDLGTARQARATREQRARDRDQDESQHERQCYDP